MRDLGQLSKRHGSDKESLYHQYAKPYEQYLGSLRHKPIKLLELGIASGASIRMWKDYFSTATIYGVDCDLSQSGLVSDRRVKVFELDQTDEAGLTAIADESGGFDVIVDDASHISSKTIASFKILWPLLKSGGLYVIEDLQTSYDPVHYTSEEACVDPDGPPLPNGGLTAVQFCKRLVDEVNYDLSGNWTPLQREYWLGYELESVQFFNNICFITKGS